MDDRSNSPIRQECSGSVLGSQHRREAIRRLSEERVDVLIVGAGFMANEYLKTLQILSVNYDLVGKRKKNVKNLEKKF